MPSNTIGIGAACVFMPLLNRKGTGLDARFSAPVFLIDA